MKTVALDIRHATPADAEALSALILASYSTLYRGWYSDEELAAAVPLMSKANPHLLSSGTYYVAELAGNIAGCGGWTETPPGGGEIVEGTAHIRHFATHPDHLRKGVARALIERCCADARERRVSLFKCMSSLPAEGFYARLGFRRVGQADFALPGGIRLAAVFMECEIG
jgi:GNAT superfamily N-acetyltransferase